MSDLVKINYTKANGETSTRDVILMSKPSTNYMALEVTELSEENRKNLLDFLAKQKKDLNDLITAINAPWKQFKADGLTILK